MSRKTVPAWLDHPRSRGVYKFACYPYAAIEGSSPLARGLLFAMVARQAAIRIIPARAGFTCCSNQ